jgi:DNA-binding transcriptional LysR family regulator
MLDWDDLRFFLAIHREGTLAKAGAALEVNATTVGRRLTTLEERIDVRLFDRVPEGYVLTPAGRDLLNRAERMEAEALALEAELVGADQRPSGMVRVSCTEMLATRFIVPRLPVFRERNPDISLDLECTNRAVSLARREADIALRLTRPVEDNVVSKKLASIPLALYASESYVARQGIPEDPERSLTGHAALLFADGRAFAVENNWLMSRLGEGRVALRSDSVSSIYAATVNGAGIALLPRAVADFDRRLRRLETESSPEPRTVWRAVHATVQKSARVRIVLDFLAEVLTPP